jgi:hypothetical protein
MLNVNFLNVKFFHLYVLNLLVELTVKPCRVSWLLPLPPSETKPDWLKAKSAEQSFDHFKFWPLIQKS